jgi:type II secretory pathway pseudopilin PulG
MKVRSQKSRSLLRAFRRPPAAKPPRDGPSPGRLRPRSRAAFTLIETLVAAVVILTSMGAIFLVSSRCVGVIQSSQQVAIASAILQERMQQLQATDWETLVDSDSYQDQVWTDPEDGTTENVDGLLKDATQSGTAQQLSNAVEWVRVSAYRPVAVATPEPAAITAKRTSTTPSLTSAATNLVDEKMVRVDLRLTWTEGQANIPRSLGLSAIVARK